MADLVFELPAGSRPAWPLTMHEPLVFGLTLCSCALLLAHLSNLDTTLQFWNCSRPCKGCGHMRHEMKGLFCVNFATPRLHWRPCKAVWHGRCYNPHPDDHFFYHVATDEDGFDW
jgi:hypothetical protein